MKPTREELREIRLNRYRKRATAQRAAAKKRTPAKRQIVGGRTRVPSISAQGVTESDEHFEGRLRVARQAKIKTKSRKAIATASRRRNRR